MHGGLIDRHLAWCQARGLRLRTISTRGYVLRRVERAISTPIAAATAEQLGRWYEHRGGAPSSRASELSHLRQFFGWMVLYDHRGDNPTARLFRPRIPRLLPRPMPHNDLAVALASAPDRIRPWLLLAAFAGLRAQEIAYLRHEDIRQDLAVLIVHDGKGGDQRVIPLHPEVARALPRSGTGWVFPRRDGKPGPNQPWLVSHLTNRHLHSLGISATLHQARHWFGTEIYRTSHDLRATQELLGHKSPVVTAGYAAWNPVIGGEAVMALTIPDAVDVRS